MEGRFTTERLVVEPWNDTLNTAELEELDGILDEDVTAFLPVSLQYKQGETNVAEWAKTFSSGTNKVSNVKLNSELAGLLILMESPVDEDAQGSATSITIMHLGYIFGQEFWGRGLATELLRGLVQQLSMEGYSGEIHAGVANGNPASVKVLQKVGFEFVPNASEESPEVDWFCRTFSSSSR
jgi:RimJ/RimL family protein N-acetyltransferase